MEDNSSAAGAAPLAPEQSSPSASMADRVANAVADALNEWADELFATRDQYIEAQRTGVMHGRRIRPELARMFAGQFRERASAVADAADIAVAAVRTALSIRGEATSSTPPIEE